jgi:hypothetical protein
MGHPLYPIHRLHCDVQIDIGPDELGINLSIPNPNLLHRKKLGATQRKNIDRSAVIFEFERFSTELQERKKMADKHFVSITFSFIADR